MSEVPEDQKIEKIYATNFRGDFARAAESLCPDLTKVTRLPQRLVRFVDCPTQFFGLRAVNDLSVDALPGIRLARGDKIILDFGLHMVGRVKFTVTAHGLNVDAPCRLRLTFGETPLDVCEGMENVKTWISTSWLPDEVINIDYFPHTITMPRRHACRYIKFDIIDTSPKFGVSFSNVSFESTTSVLEDKEIEKVDLMDPLLNKIDHASISTLRDCMQTVFEDGPRRDRRLWIGDLRLQALTNYCTFKDYGLVKRCILMIAALAREDGSLPACVFEYPTLRPATDYIVDYDALFAVVVYEYVEASGDLQLGHDLWDTVCGCLQRAIGHVDPGTHVFNLQRGEGWKFLDWNESLDRSAGLHGLLIFCLKAADRLAGILMRDEPFVDLVTKMSRAAWTFHDSESQILISGLEKQVSIASAAWLVLADVFPIEIARACLENARKHPDRIEPSTPYLWHYLCEALVSVELFDQTVDVLKTYWGGMIHAGADTFWETFDPRNPRFSPYGDVRNNSFCHAWSCTPSYLLRKRMRGAIAASSSMSTLKAYDAAWLDLTQTSVSTDS